LLTKILLELKTKYPTYQQTRKKVCNEIHVADFVVGNKHLLFRALHCLLWSR